MLSDYLTVIDNAVRWRILQNKPIATCGNFCCFVVLFRLVQFIAANQACEQFHFALLAYSVVNSKLNALSAEIPLENNTTPKCNPTYTKYKQHLTSTCSINLNLVKRANNKIKITRRVRKPKTRLYFVFVGRKKLRNVGQVLARRAASNQLGIY